MVLYAAVVALVAFGLSYETIIVNDGQIYWEMSRAFASRGDYEVHNGLHLVQSPELWINHTVYRAGRLYAKYPPLYSVVAALPYRAFGLRGLYALNGLFLGSSVVTFYALARRMMNERRALCAALGLPFCAALFSYALWELPHLVSEGFLLAGLLAWESAVRGRGRSATVSGILAGLCFGLSVGVRVQNLLSTAIALTLGALYARDRARTAIAMSLPFGLCVAAMGVANSQRFGSPNPFSYGPPGLIGSPAYLETSAYIQQPHFLMTWAWIGALALTALFWPRLERKARIGALGLAIALLFAVPQLRNTVVHLASTASSLLLNATFASTGWFDTADTGYYIEKALLGCAPVVVLGLIAIGSQAVRPSRPILQVASGMVLITLLFLSVRNPNPHTDSSAMGPFSFTPRYLVDVTPLLYLMAWERSKDVAFRSSHVAIGAAVAIALTLYFVFTGPEDRPLSKQAILLCLPIALAVALAVAQLSYERTKKRSWNDAASLTFMLCLAFGIASTLGEDTMAMTDLGAFGDRWHRKIDAALPDRAVLVGDAHAKDSAYYTRAHKDVIVVDASADLGASLLDTLQAIRRAGYPIYYFGSGRTKYPQLAIAYDEVQVTTNPDMWRLDPK